MTEANGLEPEIKALRERLSRLSEASLRINESLDFDNVLQEVVGAARELTTSRYGAITVFGEPGGLPDFIVSGITPEEHEELWNIPDGQRLFEYLSGVQDPLRIADLGTHLRSLGMPEFPLPVSVSSLLVAPLRSGGVGVGAIYLTKGAAGGEYTREDEETLAMFASQAVLVIANARRHREERRARTDLEALIETSPVGVMVFNARTGDLVSHNREIARIASRVHQPGVPLEETLKAVTVRRADGTEMSVQPLALAEAMAHGETVRVEEIVTGGPDGRSMTTLMNATPIRSENGSVETFVVTLQDMTALKQFERQRAEFLGMVSHELRAPLTSIKGSSTTLLGALSVLDPVETVQLIRIIDAQADRMRDLISELLDVARIDTGALSVVPEPVVVASLVDEARNTFLSGGGRENIAIDLEPDLPLVMADRPRAVQVLNNLLSNASKYSDESSPIRISAIRDGTHVELSVADRGRGVPAERLTQLFSKFSRFESDEGGRDIQGSGLGLAICRGIVEAHGGRIWAESDGRGLGTRFAFTLPIAEESEIDTTPEPPSSRRLQRTESDQPRILAVDDDPQTLRYVRDALAKARFDPIVTADPGQALTLLETSPPDLVLLDLVLPEIDGIDLMKAMLEVTDVPVVFLSGYGRDEIISRALEAGAADYVVKPFSPTELVARIRAALRRRTALSPSEPSEPFVLGDLTINYGERWVTVAGHPVDLTATEYNLLVELSVNAARVLTHEQLLRAVWGMGTPGGRGTIRTAVKRLRRKLGDDASNPRYILSVPRVGYRMGKGEGAEDNR